MARTHSPEAPPNWYGSREYYLVSVLLPFLLPFLLPYLLPCWE